MKVVIPIHHFPPRYQAGAENYAFGLARWLLRHGHDVHVVCVESIGAAPGSGVSAREDVYAGIPISRLSIDLAGAPDAFERSIANPSIGEWFAALLARERPDLVHVNSAYLLSVTPIEVAKQRGLPVLVTLHDYWFLCPRVMLQTPAGATCNVPDDAAACVWCLATERRRFRFPDLATRGALGRLARPLLHSRDVARALGIAPDLDAVTARRARVWHALAQADRVIATTEFQRQLFVRCGFPAARLQLCPIGVDCAVEPHPPRAHDAGDLRVAYIAQVAPHKGLHLLIEAMNRLRVDRRRMCLRVYGDLASSPGYAQRMRGLAARNPAIELMGAIDNTRVGECLADADILVAPSISPDTGSLAVLEARAAGRPAIVARVGALPELIRDGVDGLTFAAGDVADLAAVLQRLLDEPGLARALTSQTRPPRRIDDEMAELLPLYEQLARAA